MRIDNPTFAPGGLNTITNATTAASATSVTQASQLWVQTNSYVAGALVHRDSIIYRANGAVPANTSFAVGTTGATWTLIGSSGVPLWTVGGTIGINGTTTAPTKVNVIADESYYRQVGSRQWEVAMHFNKNAGGSDGAGDYLYSIPAGAPNIQAFGIQPFYTGDVNGSPAYFQAAAMATSYGSAYHNILPSSTVQIILWDARTFRLLIHVPGTALRNAGSGWFPFSGTTGFQLRFAYQSV